MPLNPQAEGLLEMLSTMGAKPFSEMEPVECRAALDLLLATLPPSAAGIAGVTPRAVPGPGGDIPVRVYTPTGAGPFPIVVYFHGGGFVCGSLDGWESLCRDLCAGAGAIVVAVDYRLSPEHKFPAAHEDAFAATRWVADNAAELGGDPARLAVAGDSAGGNLAAATAIRARDEGGPALRAQLLVYPMADGSGPHRGSMVSNAEGYLLSAADMEYFYGHYTNTPADRSDARLSPALTKDLAGLPPALVQSAEFDPLLDEGEDYAKALGEAGVPVTLTRYDGAIHGTICFAPMLGQGTEMRTEATAWLRARLSP